MNNSTSGGFRTFLIIWVGQLVSLVGSQLTGFAMSVWVYDETRSVSLLALAQIAFSAPFVLLSPLAGVLADRWNRRTAMIVSDFGSGFAVAAAAVLYISGHLQPWMVIPLNFAIAAFATLMWPAYTASVTLLMPKEQYGRANGFVQLGESITQIVGPAIAGALYVSIRLGNMALIDAVTYAFSVVLMLLFVRSPNPPRTAEGHAASNGSIWQEMRYGWDYIVDRKGLLALLVFFMVTNFLGGVMGPLFTPLILDTWTAEVLGFLSTIMGVGMLAGTLVMSAWGGTKRKIYTLFAASLVSSVFLALVGLRASIPLIAVCGFGFMFTMPLMNASSQAIWQSKVAPDVQGRVFSVRRAIAWSSNIVAPLLAAPLADYIFKPGMTAGGGLAALLGPFVGVGASRGVGVLISVLGVLSVAATVLFYMNARIRNVEIDLPDHVTAPAAAATPGLGGTAD